MKHIIYKVTNNKNRKFYIGAHSTDNVNDGYFGSGKVMLRALKKYGVGNFTKEILHIFDSKEDMFAKEREIVTEDSVKGNDNYNMVAGGVPLLCINIRIRARGGYQNNSREWYFLKSIKER